MRLPLLVVSRLAAYNQLATHGMTVSVPDAGTSGAPADAADVPDLLACVVAAQQRRVDKFREFRRCAPAGSCVVHVPAPGGAPVLRAASQP